MKVVQFTIPVSGEKNIVVQRDQMAFMYPHLHRHDEIQITLILKGSGTLVVENNMHPFQPLDVCCIGANQPHVFKNEPFYYNGGQEVEAVSIFFNPRATLKNLFDLSEMNALQQFLHQHQSGFLIAGNASLAIREILLKMEKATGTQLLIFFIELLNACMAAERRELSTATDLSNCSEHTGIRLGTIYNYILANYKQPITLEDVAAQAHMTPQAFCRFFKKRTQHTFVSFLNEVRVSEACKQFTRGGFESIATVAYSCGFNSITNFNRVFKSVHGKSPSEYLTSLNR